jgi:hypothetical protein
MHNQQCTEDSGPIDEQSYTEDRLPTPEDTPEVQMNQILPETINLNQTSQILQIQSPIASGNGGHGGGMQAGKQNNKVIQLNDFVDCTNDDEAERFSDPLLEATLAFRTTTADTDPLVQQTQAAQGSPRHEKEA